MNFLDASSHLYKRLCPSVRRSVRPSVRRSHTSWNPAKKPFWPKLLAVRAWTHLMPCIRPCLLWIMLILKYVWLKYNKSMIMTAYCTMGSWAEYIRYEKWQMSFVQIFINGIELLFESLFSSPKYYISYISDIVWRRILWKNMVS